MGLRARVQRRNDVTAADCGTGEHSQPCERPGSQPSVPRAQKPPIRKDFNRLADNPDERDEGPELELKELFARVRASLMAWMQALDHLRAKS